MEDRKDSCFCGKVHSETLPMCTGINVTPTGTTGPLIAKIPVVLAEKDIQIDVEADIELKEEFFEIKRIKKNVFLTQCRLLPTAGQRDCKTGNLISGKLFLKGFVEKNFEYATVKCSTKDVVSGDIKHTTVKVPFHCVTEVFYDRQPVLSFKNGPKELDSFFVKCEDCKHCDDEWMGKNPCQTDFEETIFFVEKPFCELVSARIIEADINREEEREKGDCVETFDKVVEKMVVFLRVKVLQLQQVRIS